MRFLNSIWPWKKFRAYERDVTRLRNELIMVQRELNDVNECWRAEIDEHSKTRGNMRKLGEVFAKIGGISTT